MCGIAGLVSRDALAPDARARAIGDARRPDPPRPGRRRAARRRPRGARPPPSQHRRSGRRPSAAVERRRQRSGSRFNGEIYNHADVRPRARSRRPPLPHAVRHRDDRPRLRAVGRRLRPPLPRHVRVRASGTRRSAGCCSSAIAWASSRSTGARARATRCCSRPRSRRILASGLVEPRPNHAVLPELLSTRYVVRRRDAVRGIYKLLPGHRLVFEDGAVRDPAVPGTCRAGRRPTRSWRGAPKPRASSTGSASCSRSRSGCG